MIDRFRSVSLGRARPGRMDRRGRRVGRASEGGNVGHEDLSLAGVTRFFGVQWPQSVNRSSTTATNPQGRGPSSALEAKLWPGPIGRFPNTCVGHSHSPRPADLACLAGRSSLGSCNPAICNREFRPTHEGHASPPRRLISEPTLFSQNPETGDECTQGGHRLTVPATKNSTIADWGLQTQETSGTTFGDEVFMARRLVIFSVHFRSYLGATPRHGPTIRRGAFAVRPLPLAQESFFSGAHSWPSRPDGGSRGLRTSKRHRTAI